MNHRALFSVFVIVGVIVSGAPASPVSGGSLPECTIDFEATCPDALPECGATFAGGASCAFELLFGCYSSGSFSYKVTSVAPVTITLSGDLDRLEVFFAHQGAAAGTMRFFDTAVGGSEVGSPISTNGDCLLLMPSLQTVTFNTPVRRIEVSFVGGVSWIDDFRVNPPVTCPADLDGDMVVGFNDLLSLLVNWGPCIACPQDIGGDGDVGFQDLLVVLATWGACS